MPIIVRIPGGPAIEPKIKSLYVSENGTYEVEEGLDGYGPVTVNVKSPGGGEFVPDYSWTIGDGNTHIWIHLEEGYTSPMLGVCPNGTVTVDWGDGSTPDVLTGTTVGSVSSHVEHTPNHNYAAPGDYVITLTVDGEMGLMGHSSIGPALLQHQQNRDDANNAKYWNSVRRVELGSGVTRIGAHSFKRMYNLLSIIISDSVTYIDEGAFSYCYSLKNAIIPNTVSHLARDAFNSCWNLEGVVFPPECVDSTYGIVFTGCYRLKSVVIPEQLTTISSSAFANCFSLTSAILPKNIASIGSSAFAYCYGLTSMTIPQSVSTIGSGCFSNCLNIRYFDFSKHTSVPTMAETSSLPGVYFAFEIRVPAALVDEWKAATNWSTYADKIVGV